MDINEYYKVNRSQIEHVDNTISQRIVWLVISQSFFFSGYSVLITGSPADLSLIGKQHMLLILFPLSALIMNLVSLFDVVCGMVYLRKLTIDFNKKKEASNADFTFPPINGFKMLNQLKNLSSIILPAVFIIIWIIILIH